jgi:hypothetical protein
MTLFFVHAAKNKLAVSHPTQYKIAIILTRRNEEAWLIPETGTGRPVKKRYPWTPGKKNTNGLRNLMSAPTVKKSPP